MSAARLLATLAGFAALFLVTRFIARGHLAPLMDQECHIGGIAIDVAAHGVRFPLLAYAPNEYDNGSLVSGLLAAMSFAVLGRSLFALKMVTHIIVAAGAVATLWLLRACLAELGLMSRRARWTAVGVLLVALAVAPRVVTLVSMYAVGNHAEGSALNTILLALFAHRARARSALRTGILWALVGLALYVNKGTLLVVPVLGAAELALSWRTRGRLLAAAAGLCLGALPELLVIAQRHAMGWAQMAQKAGHSAPAFPVAIAESVLTLAEYRSGLCVAWMLAIAFGSIAVARSLRGAPAGGATRRPGEVAAVRAPIALALVVAVTWAHLVALSVMAVGGLDAYTLYGYPTLAVLLALMAAWGSQRIAVGWGAAAGTAAGVAAVALALFLYRPDSLTWETDTIAALWRNRAGAACSWRFAEGFEREYLHGLAPPGRSRGEHAIERCRTLSEPAQVLDCIGGIARELNWRHGGRVAGEPPAGLSADERRAYAFHYGTHRRGDAAPCGDFTAPELRAECVTATQLDCLVFGDVYTRVYAGRGLGRPRCDVGEPPFDGYWREMRRELFARGDGSGPDLPTAAAADNDLSGCRAVFERCY